MTKIIEGYENYTISDSGEVYNIKYNRKLTYNIDKQGYITVELWNSGEGRKFSVHRLVCKAFIPNPENKSCVNHIDSNRSNNKVENLEWVTNKENVNHKNTKRYKGRLSKTRIIKLYKSKSWGSVEEFLIEIIKQ